MTTRFSILTRIFSQNVITDRDVIDILNAYFRDHPFYYNGDRITPVWRTNPARNSLYINIFDGNNIKIIHVSFHFDRTRIGTGSTSHIRSDMHRLQPTRDIEISEDNN